MADLSTNLSRIKSTLIQSGINRDKPALYQAINQILDFISSNQNPSITSLDGNSLPLQDPHRKGQLWNNGGVVTVSNG